MTSLHVVADLDFTVSGRPATADPGRPIRGHVRGRGSQLTVFVDDPVGAVRSLPRHLTGIGGPSKVAERLSRSGLSLIVRGPSGTLVTLGAVRPGRVASSLVRSRNIQLGRPHALAPVLMPMLISRIRPYAGRLTVAAGAAGAVYAGAVYVARRHRGKTK